MSFGESGRVLRRIAFRPTSDDSQAVAFGPASANSVALRVGKSHWIWATEHCRIFAADGVAGAGALSFPLPALAPIEYTPTELGVDDVISVIQIAAAGTLYIGRSEE